MIITFRDGSEMTLIPPMYSRYNSGVIRIDAEVYAEIEKRATGLGCTPNSVLREVFGLPPIPDGRTRKARNKGGN